MSIDSIAEQVDEAARSATAIPQLAPELGLTLTDAYAIQRASVARRLARGERRTGVKMGFTSRAKMAQMGVHSMIWGRLTSGMQVEESGSVRMADYVHPRVEPEIAYLICRPLSGRVTLAEAGAAIEAVAGALEIIDSRYQDFRFSLTDVVADNSSSSGYVIGPWRRPDLDASTLGLVLSLDGAPEAVGSSAAILGNPLRALAAAAAFAEEAQQPLQPGWIVLAGGATGAVALRPGAQVRLEVEALGDVQFRVED